MGRRMVEFGTPVVFASVAVLLCGCGGGGGGGDTTVTTTVAATTTTLTTPGVSLYTCESTHIAPTLTNMDNKGICIDDTTFWHCPDAMTGMWPNTAKPTTSAEMDKVKVKSMRLFAPWKPAWGGDTERLAAWEHLATWVKTNNAKVLIGTEVTCQKDVDDTMWQWNLDLVKKLGKEHVMGFAIGNEMDIYWYNYNAAGWSKECVEELWTGGRYWQTLQDRVKDIDAAGFTDSPITIIWAMSVLGGTPWLEDPKQALVNTLVTEAYKKWPDRWVWSFNIYSIWDHNLWPTSASDCAVKSAAAVGIDYTKNMIKAVRKSIKATTGSDTSPIWVGENGWSSPLPDGCSWTPGQTGFSYCPDFGSVDTLRKAYEAFLSWDLTIEDGVHGVDHVFYFTMRDSFNVKSREGFGLIANCGDTKCKISGSPGPSPPSPPSPGPATKSTCADLKCGNHDTTCWCTDTCKSHDSCCPDYDSVCGGTLEWV